MPKSSRTDARRDYRHFPREYTDLLVAFERDGRAALAFPSRREASTARRLLYQFKMLALASADTDPEDAQARWLVDVFNTCTLRLEPSDGDGGTYEASQGVKGPTTLILDTNPLVRAMRARDAQAKIYEAGLVLYGDPVQPSEARGLDAAVPLAINSTVGNDPLAPVDDAARRVPASAARQDSSARHPQPNLPVDVLPVSGGCQHPTACRSIIAGAPAFCECGDDAAREL